MFEQYNENLNITNIMLLGLYISELKAFAAKLYEVPFESSMAIIFVRIYYFIAN